MSRERNLTPPTGDPPDLLGRVLAPAGASTYLPAQRGASA